MHTCPPPIDEFSECFDENASVNGDFGHTLLVQSEEDDGSLAAALKGYFESAHLDARNIFHANIGIDLHPDANGDDEIVTYPGSLPSRTRRGLFGEVLAGLLTESYEYVGDHEWCVPVFLFRYHDDAFNYLFSLARDPTRSRQTIGRLGSDFIGLSLSEDGAVGRIISGEAKWRATLTPATVDEIMLGEWVDDGDGGRVRSGKGVWNSVNHEPPTPSGVRQLQRILQEHDPDGYDATILSLDRALVVKDPEPIPKTDLIVFAGNGRARREDDECLLPFEEAPEEYNAGNDLQIVEVLFVAGEDLIDAVYASLWEEGDDA
tara:strand:- start:17883 stop:18839 length:957 start_codon:yes stop_codon:yes gene_type:complete